MMAFVLTVRVLDFRAFTSKSYLFFPIWGLRFKYIHYLGMHILSCDFNYCFLMYVSMMNVYVHDVYVMMYDVFRCESHRTTLWNVFFPPIFMQALGMGFQACIVSTFTY